MTIRTSAVQRHRWTLLLEAARLQGPFDKALPHRPKSGRNRPRRRTRPALLRPHPRCRYCAVLSHDGRARVVAIGRSGIAARKREGDGASPRGRITPLAALMRRRGPRPFPIPSRRVRSDDGWCDAPQSRSYNTACRLPFPASAEVMARADGLYDTVVVTDHNQRPRIAGAGSAVFIHVARPGLTGTDGCIALPAAVWRRGQIPLGPYLIGVDPRPMR